MIYPNVDHRNLKWFFHTCNEIIRDKRRRIQDRTVLIIQKYSPESWYLTPCLTYFTWFLTYFIVNYLRAITEIISWVTLNDEGGGGPHIARSPEKWSLINGLSFNMGLNLARSSFVKIPPVKYHHLIIKINGSIKGVNDDAIYNIGRGNNLQNQGKRKVKKSDWECKRLTRKMKQRIPLENFIFVLLVKL